jgi:hypothetical protein
MAMAYKTRTPRRSPHSLGRAYPKPKPGRIDGGARRGLVSLLWRARALLPSAGMTKNDQAIEQLERDSTNHEQIDGRDPGGMIAQECLPTLGSRWTRSGSVTFGTSAWSPKSHFSSNSGVFTTRADSAGARKGRAVSSTDGHGIRCQFYRAPYNTRWSRYICQTGRVNFSKQKYDSSILLLIRTPPAGLIDFPRVN